jgi:hypothetical protein
MLASTLSFADLLDAGFAASYSFFSSVANWLIAIGPHEWLSYQGSLVTYNTVHALYTLFLKRNE